MNTVNIDGHQLYEEYGLILNKKEIAPPSPKLITIDIPGADGFLDLTESLTGDVKYDNREITMTFTKIGNSPISLSYYRIISNAFHGKMCKIIFSDIPGYYYYGRLTVSKFDYSVTTGEIELKCSAQPYALELLDSVEDWLWDPFNFNTDIVRAYKEMKVAGETTFIVYGSRKTVCPEFIVSDEMRVEFEGATYNLSKGNNRVVNISIVEGENIMKFTGNGTVSILFRGGAL